MQREKTYYNQKNVIDLIHKETGCPPDTISDILNALGDMVKDKFSDCNDQVEIKLFPGLKVASEYMPSGLSAAQRLHIDSGYSLCLSAFFTDDFRKKVRQLHNNKTA